MPIFDGAYAFYEKTGTASPGSAGFSVDGGGKAAWPYMLPVRKPDGTADTDKMPTALYDAVKKILGTTEATGNGRLTRSLPAALPVMPWLTACAVTSVRGMGVPKLKVLNAADRYECPPLEMAYACYPLYEFGIEWQHKPYALLGDATITSSSMSYYLDAGAPASKTVFNEWIRYTDYDVMPAVETAQARRGQFQFRTTGAGNNYRFDQLPRITIPKSTIRFRWYQVPFRYVNSTSSYLINHIGKINQLEFYGNAPGVFLYSGLVVSKRYPPPVPEKTLWTGSTSYSLERLCDIEMVWEYTGRTPTVPAPTPSNASWIASGHNTVPFLGNEDVERGFYYATVSDPKSGTLAGNKQHPIHFSFPFQLLFQDPTV